MISEQKRRLLGLAALAVGAVVGLAGCTTGDSSDEGATQVEAGELEGKVVLLAPNSQVTRFESYDKPAMEEKLAEIAPGLELEVQSADNDPLQQLQQAQSAITQGAVALIVAPPVPTQAQSVVEVAHAADVPVINYAYAAAESDVDAYVTVPFESIGEQTANLIIENELDGRTEPLRIAEVTGDPSFFFDQEIKKGQDETLASYIEDGSIEVVCSNDNIELSTENARVAVEGCLSQQDDIDIVTVHNDSSALGAVAALSAQDLLGTIPIYGGYDSEPSVVQQVLAGNVVSTMVPPYEQMASSAIELAVALASGDEAAAESMYNGEYDMGTTMVPVIYNENILITAENVGEELVDTGILTREEVCAGPAASSEFCEG